MTLRPSQCDIKKISITNHTKSIVIDKQSSFLEFFGSLDIFENVFCPFITADLVLLDGASFIEKYNITGNEDFEIEIVGYGSDQPLKYKLKVSELIYNVPNPNLRSKNVGLRLVSEEYLRDSANHISKSYNVGTGDIVRDITSNILKSKKKLFVEESKDLPLTVIPYLTPFQSIDFIRKRLVSQKYKSSTFLFYETSDGYLLTTVEGLFERESSKAQKFFQNEAISQDVKGGSISDFDSFHLFFNYTVKSSFNLNHSLKYGGLRTLVSQYDITTKKYQQRLFQNNPSNKFFVDKSGGMNPIITQTIFNEYSQNSGKPLFIPFSKYKDTDNNTDNFLFDTVAERLCFSNLFTMEKTFIDIPGNTRINAGSIIHLQVPRYDSLESKQPSNQMDSGHYMVTAVKHTITNSDTARYDTHLELMRFGRGVLQ
jgi:hypothetical protein